MTPDPGSVLHNNAFNTRSFNLTGYKIFGDFPYDEHPWHNPWFTIRRHVVSSVYAFRIPKLTEALIVYLYKAQGTSTKASYYMNGERC